jgi:hypothetical protein
MARVIDIVWVVLDMNGDLIRTMLEEDEAELEAESLNEFTGVRGFHVKEAQLIWNE